MTDQTDPTATTPDEGSVDLPPAFTASQVENFLTIDQIMNSVRRSRRIARICLAADLESEYLDALDTLSQMVDAEGHLVNEDASMEEVAEATTLRDRIADLRARMRAQTFSVMFEAMDSDAWEIFEKRHRGPDGAVKDTKAWQDELIVACAINPTFTLEQVAAARKQFAATQINELATAAYSACSSGGVDVPKLPSFWHSPKPQGSSLS